MKPGLYDKDNNLTYSWDELIDSELVHLDNGILTTNYIADPDDSDDLTDEEYEEQQGKEWDINKSANELVGTLVLPNDNSIYSLGNACFCALENLEEVILPDSLECIESSAFASSGIKALNIPDNVDEIGRAAFFHCLNLEFIKMPKNLKLLDKNIFAFHFNENTKISYKGKLYKPIEFVENIKKSENIGKMSLDELLDKYTFKEVNQIKTPFDNIELVEQK